MTLVIIESSMMTYNSITSESMWQALESIGVPRKIIKWTKICLDCSSKKRDSKIF